MIPLKLTSPVKGVEETVLQAKPAYHESMAYHEKRAYLN